MSSATCHMSHVASKFFLQSGEAIPLEGLLSTGPTPSSFQHCPISVNVFKASALWANAFYKSKCPSVCQYVRLFVRLSVCSLLRYHFNVFLPPLPEVRCPIFLEIRNPWGKVMERSGLRFEHSSKIAVQKKFVFLLILPYKTRWKPRFPMD